MIWNFKLFRKQILGLSLSEGNFKARGFETGHPAQPRLEMVAKTVVNGYNLGVEHGLHDDLRIISQGVKKELIGFHYEGIAMGVYALDIFSFGRKGLFWKYMDSLESNHEYMSYIGAGLALGVFKRPVDNILKKGDPVYSCLALDGVGFYYAMFETKKLFGRFYVPKSIKSNPFYQNRYDNGIGRAVWFYNSGEPELIKATIDSFPKERRSSIWSGVGLAAEYAGGVSEEKITQLKKLSGEHSLYLAQGVILATHTRFTAGNPHEDKSTVNIVVGKSAESCHQVIVDIMKTVKGKREYEGGPTFAYVLKQVREWVAKPAEKTTVLRKLQG